MFESVQLSACILLCPLLFTATKHGVILTMIMQKGHILCSHKEYTIYCRLYSAILL